MGAEVNRFPISFDHFYTSKSINTIDLLYKHTHMVKVQFAIAMHAYRTNNERIDNAILLDMAREITEKHTNKGMGLVQSSIKPQNALLSFQG